MIIAVANQKGGVTKTTAVHNIGASLARRGKRVLAIDFDPQASLTICMGKEPVDFEYTVCEIMQRNPIDIEKCICNISTNLDLLPSSLYLAAQELELTSRTARETILAKALRPIRDNYDYILIDCPPQLSVLTLNALSAADQVLVPSQATYLSYRGLDMLENTLNDVRDLINPNLKIMGVIVTLYEKNVKKQQEIMELLKGKYKIIGTTKKTAAAAAGIYDGLAVVEADPRSAIAKEYEQIVDNILN